MKRLLSITGVLGLAVAALAIGSMVKVLETTYGKPAGDLKCAACHIGKMGGKLNPYGTDVKAALKGSKTVTAAILHSLDAKDSDGDGAKNGAELKAGKNPGVK